MSSTRASRRSPPAATPTGSGLHAAPGRRRVVPRRRRERDARPRARRGPSAPECLALEGGPTSPRQPRAAPSAFLERPAPSSPRMPPWTPRPNEEEDPTRAARVPPPAGRLPPRRAHRATHHASRPHVAARLGTTERDCGARRRTTRRAAEPRGGGGIDVQVRRLGAECPGALHRSVRRAWRPTRQPSRASRAECLRRRKLPLANVGGRGAASAAWPTRPWSQRGLDGARRKIRGASAEAPIEPRVPRQRRPHCRAEEEAISSCRADRA